MKTITSNIIFILFALSLMTCDKNSCENCYPTVFECKVDGKTWKTSCESKDGLGCTAWDFKYYSSIPSMTLRGDNELKNSSLEIKIRNYKLSIGENKLYLDQFIGTYFGDGSNTPSCETYRIDTIMPYSFNISELDTIKQIIKGTFNFFGKDKCGKSKSITEGKFDLIYGN